MIWCSSDVDGIFGCDSNDPTVFPGRNPQQCRWQTVKGSTDSLWWTNMKLTNCELRKLWLLVMVYGISGISSLDAPQLSECNYSFHIVTNAASDWPVMLGPLSQLMFLTGPLVGLRMLRFKQKQRFIAERIVRAHWCLDGSPDGQISNVWSKPEEMKSRNILVNAWCIG